MAIQRLSGGLTPANGADPRTFPTIWNVTAAEIEAQGTAITGAESDIDGLQSDVSALEAKNLPSFGTATPSTGDTLVFDGSDYIPGSIPGRNLLYNGAMQVHQRGTSSTGITGPGYWTADRYNLSYTSLGTWTQTVEAGGPTGSGFTKSLKMECTTADASPAASDALWVTQRLEGQDLQGLKKGTADAESLTLSFWVKSNVTGTYTIHLRDIDNNRHIAKAYTIDSSGTWEKKIIIFAGDTTGAFDNDNGRSLDIDFQLAMGSDYTSGTLATSWAVYNAANRAVGQVNLASATSNYWQVTGVQLETGTVATAFEHKPYGVELALCQRYYYAMPEPSTGIVFRTYNMRTFTSDTPLQYQLPVPMRANPTVTITVDINDGTPTAPALFFVRNARDVWMQSQVPSNQWLDLHNIVASAEL